jgi:hypothetical protein
MLRRPVDALKDSEKPYSLYDLLNIVWIHAGPTSGKSHSIKDLRRLGFTVIDTDELFIIIDNAHFNDASGKSRNNGMWDELKEKRWHQIYSDLIKLILTMDRMSRHNVLLDETSPEHSRRTIVLTNLFLPVPWTLSTFVEPGVMRIRSGQRSGQAKIISEATGRSWFENYKSRVAGGTFDHGEGSFILGPDQYLGDFLTMISNIASQRL